MGSVPCLGTESTTQGREPDPLENKNKHMDRRADCEVGCEKCMLWQFTDPNIQGTLGKALKADSTSQA